MTHEQIAMVLSLVGMVVNIFSYQARKKTTILIMQSVGSSVYLASYVFSGGGMGVCLNVIYLIRNFLYTRIDGKSRKFRVGVCYALCASYLLTYAVYTTLMGLPLAANLWNVLPIIGSVFGTVATLQTVLLRFHFFKIGDCVSWFAYNCHIGLGAIGGIVGTILNSISILVAIWRIKREEKE